MNRILLKQGATFAFLCTLWSVGCNESRASPDPVQTAVPRVTITSSGPNAVSVWNEIAAKTINVAPAVSGTGEERQPLFVVDLATVNVAIYDAVNAIARTHKPYAITPTAASAGASMEAAASAAAYGVLKGLFPARSNIYQSTYDTFIAAIPEGDAKSRGIALGAEVARGILALRANDGRNTPLAEYVPGTAPGKFRGSKPGLRSYLYVKPFAMTSAAQFRALGPNAIDSSAYAADFNETKALGAAVSSLRSAAQTEVARFYTEPPPIFFPRNLRQFATSQQDLADNARLMALIWVAQTDSNIACIESKYHFDSWRPKDAIPLADTTANAATVAEPAWTPLVASPNYPEYPATHPCVSAATAEAIRGFFHTNQVSFTFDSTVPDTVVHRFTTTDALVNEVQLARIHGGMHFRTATEHGAALGKNVAKWVSEHYFLPR